MIGIDTNLLVRYLAQDDAVQSPIATRIIEEFSVEEPGYVSQIVLVETVWVLTRSYRMGRAQIADVVEALLRTRELVIERADVGYLALSTYRATGADFSDAVILHGNRLAGCFQTLTFDKGAVAQAGMRFPADL